MTNALATLQKGAIKLSEMEELILAEAAQDSAAYDPIPTRIKIGPGGINQFVTSDGETLKELHAIVAISQKARAYWPDKGTGAPPLCASPNGSDGMFNPAASDAQIKAAMSAKAPHAAIVALSKKGASLPPADQLFDCATCPLAQWGSVHQGGATGKGQACKTLRRLVVLVDGWTQPALLTLPPTSVKVWDTYCSVLARNKSAYFAHRTLLTLSGQKSANNDAYSIVEVESDGLLSKEGVTAVIAIRREFEALVRNMPIDGSEYEVVDDNGVPASEADAGPDVPF